MVSSFHEFFQPHDHDRQNVLLCSDVLRANAFWCEEMARLESLTSCRLQGAHRQKSNWQVGFLFQANAAKRAFAEPISGEEKQWAFLRFVSKN